MDEKMKQDVQENVEETETEVQEEEVEIVEHSEVDELNEQLNEARAEAMKWKTDYYKVFADMENLKKRLTNEHNNQLKFMMQSFVEELLPVLDNFERSLNVETNEETEPFLKGYKMIYDQLMNILKKEGVEVIEALGKEFDPNYHQAVMMANDENYESNIVVEELQKGYMLKGRVIRATLVKVNQ